MSAAPTDGDQVHEAVSRQLRAAGQRYTASRRRLIELLANAGSPLSIVEVLGRAPGLPQSSLYRNLATLEQAGVVVRVGTGDDFARYELAEPISDHHHHLVCTSCGRVSDFTLPARLEALLDDTISRSEVTGGFIAAAHRIDLFGQCEDCDRGSADSVR
jgi:Fe2+ or Zn2+ uptake regulation protein